MLKPLLRSLMRLSPAPAIVHIHATGGLDMMKAAAEAVDGRAKLIAVTILTSLADDDIWAAGFETAKARHKRHERGKHERRSSSVPRQSPLRQRAPHARNAPRNRRLQRIKRFRDR